MKFPIQYVRMQAEFIARCFQKSREQGWDSDCFAEVFMTSDYGVEVLTDQRMIEYSDWTFLYEGLERNLPAEAFVKGSSYDYEVLEFAGYIYKYWISTRDWDPREIWKIAPLSRIARGYGFYHTQDFDYVINDLIERP